MQARTFLCNIIEYKMHITYFTIMIDDFIILQGEKCNKCDGVTHVHCLANYASNHGGLGCPNCNQPMSKHNSSRNAF